MGSLVWDSSELLKLECVILEHLSGESLRLASLLP
jgi:hypothetical protein